MPDGLVDTSRGGRGLYSIIKRSRDAWDVLNNLLNSPDVGLEPQGMGLVLKNPKNVRMIMESVKKGLAGKTPGNSPHNMIDVVNEYMKAKYPRLYALPRRIDLTGSFLNPNEAGQYRPRSNEVGIRPVAFPSQIADTFGHELTHALQFQRPGQQRIFNRTLGQIEAQAERGGATAANTFGEFAKLASSQRRNEDLLLRHGIQTIKKADGTLWALEQGVSPQGKNISTWIDVTNWEHSKLLEWLGY